MGVYERLILPKLLDWAMRDDRLAPYRERTTGAARGLVLEIGIGSGLNLPHYNDDVERVCAIDPSSELLRRARDRANSALAPVSLLRASAETLPFAAAVFDAVVMTWTLCSIPDPLAALIEIRRVLKSDGRLVFVEHGLSPQRRVAAWQRRLDPFWTVIAGGCHLDRRIDALIGEAGFHLERLDTGHMPGPKPWTFMYQGSALP
jgi:SAM-dependent methyltransferase